MIKIKEAIIMVLIGLFIISCNSGGGGSTTPEVLQPIELWAPSQINVGETYYASIRIFLNTNHHSRTVTITKSNNNISLPTSSCTVEQSTEDYNSCTLTVVGAAPGIVTVTTSSPGYQTQSAEILVVQP